VSEVNEQALPLGWAVASLREVLSNATTLDPKRNGPGKFFYVDIESVDNKRQVISNPKHLANSQAPSRARNELKSGDVIFSLVRPYLKNIAVVQPNLDGAIGSTAFCVCRPMCGVSSRFLYNLLRRDSFIHAIPTYGSSPPSARDLEFLSQTILVPPSNEQERIADALDELLPDLDAGVAGLERVQAKLKQFRTLVLKAAVEGTLTAEWRTENPASERAPILLKRILLECRNRWEDAQLIKFKEKGITPLKDWKRKYREPSTPDTSGLTPLPDGWCWASPAQIGDVQLGRQRAPRHHSGKHIRPYLRVANVYEDRIDLRSVYEMNFTPDEFKTFQLHSGDILLNEGQSVELVGRAAIYRGELPGACFTNTLVRFRPYDGILPEFALIYFKACLRSHRFRKLARWTTNIAHLGADRFAAMEMPVPPLAEQNAIVEAVEEQLSMVDHLEADIAAKLASAQALRQSILRHAFTGQLVPQDPNDEPASELLKRIAAEREERVRQTKAAKGKTAKGVSKVLKKSTKSATKVPVRVPSKRPRIKTAA